MNRASLIADALVLVCLIAALFRAPLVALPLAPPCALVLAAFFGLVDLSSASHPLRYVVPASSAALALLVANHSWNVMRAIRLPRFVLQQRDRLLVRPKRTLAASLLVFASSGPDVLALLAWRLPGPWILIPFQIGVCLAVLGVLVAPERWVRKWTTT